MIWPAVVVGVLILLVCAFPSSPLCVWRCLDVFVCVFACVFVPGCPNDCPPARPVIGPNNFGIFIARSQRQRPETTTRPPKNGRCCCCLLLLVGRWFGSWRRFPSLPLTCPRLVPLIPRSCDADTNLAY